MHRKELHDLPDAHLEPEFLSNRLCFFPGNAAYLCQPLRLPLHNSQGVAAEAIHDPGRHLGADTLDDPAGQVIQDLHGGLGHHALQKFCFKLTAITGMIAPAASDHQPFSHAGHGNRANHCHILPAAYTHTEDSIAIFVVLIYHSADGTLNDLQFLCHKSIPLSAVLYSILYFTIFSAKWQYRHKWNFVFSVFSVL